MRGFRHGSVLALFVLLVSLTVPPLFAQQQGARLEGTVQDSSGLKIPGVMVMAINQATNVAREAITNEAGVYRFPNLPPGSYTISAELTGFKKYELTDFRLDTGATAQVEINLEVGSITETVTVTSESVQQVQLSTSDVSDLVFERKIKELPLNGRRPIELVQLQPGIPRNSTVSSGGRAGYNAIALDGIDITSSELGTGSGLDIATEVAPSVDAIEEFRVITSNPSAEYSRSSGFQVTMTTKSGTNEYHGSAYWFHRNTIFNANTFFNNASAQPIDRTRLIRNQFGGTFGGPVKLPWLYDGTDRTFFFFNYEGTREVQNRAQTRTVLTPDMRSGIFRFITEDVTRNPETGGTLDANHRSVVDPKTGAIRSGVEGIQQVNLIDSDKNYLDGIGWDTSGLVRKMIDLTPFPNDYSVATGSGDGLNTGGFRFVAPSDEIGNLYTTKVDHVLSSKHTLSVRFNIGTWDRVRGDSVNEVYQPFPGINPRGRLEDQMGGQISLISGLTPTMTNEFRIGFSYNKRNFNGQIQTPGTLVINPPGSNPYSAAEVYKVPRQTTQIVDNISWVKGSHAMRMGFSLQTSVLNTTWGDMAIRADFSADTGGLGGATFDINDLFGGNKSQIPDGDEGLAQNMFNYVTGRVGGVETDFNAISSQEFGPVGTNKVRGYRGRDWGLFFQDDWKVNPNLTLNLGVRWDYYQVPWEVNSFFSLPKNRSLISTQLDPSIPNTPVEFGPVGPAFGTQLYKDDYNNFAPVVGFSWDPFGTNRTAIRGSFRISYDHLFTASLRSIDTSAPGLATSSGTNGDDMSDSQGLTGISGPRPPRLGDLKPMPDVYGGTVGNGVVDLAGILDITQTQKPYGIIPDGRVSLGPKEFEPTMVNPYSQQWSFGIQHEIFENTILEARYIGKRSNKLYFGMGANQFRVPSAWLPAIQDVNKMLRMTRGEAYAFMGVTPPGGMDLNRTTSLRDLYGNASSSATDISQWTPGIMYDIAPEALKPIFLATTSSFESNYRRQDTEVDLVGLIAGLDVSSGSRIHRESFLESAGFNAMSRSRGNLPLILGIPANSFRPSPQFLNGPDIITNAAYSSYHGMQLQVNRRFSRGLQFQMNYTLAKFIDIADCTNCTGAQINNFFEINNRRSISSNDMTHNLKTNFIWELPFGYGRKWASGVHPVVSHIIGGWQLTGILEISGDYPFNTYYSSQRTSYQGGDQPNWVEGFEHDRGTAKIGSVGRNSVGQVVYWQHSDFGREGPGRSGVGGIFEQPLIGTEGDVPRNYFRGPGYFMMDMALMKNFNIDENKYIQFRAEAFNLFNNVNFGNPSQNLRSSSFGIITGTTGNPRLLQFALKFFF